MGLAALWETWIGPNGEEVDTLCIVTTAANAVSVAIHPRLPVVVEPDDFDVWLDPDEATAEAAVALLEPPDDDVLTFTPIGDAVNKVVNDGPEIQEPIGPALTSEHRPADATAVQPSLFRAGAAKAE